MLQDVQLLAQPSPPASGLIVEQALVGRMGMDPIHDECCRPGMLTRNLAKSNFSEENPAALLPYGCTLRNLFGPLEMTDDKTRCREALGTECIDRILPELELGPNWKETWRPHLCVLRWTWQLVYYPC